MNDIIEPSTKPKPFVFVVMPFSKEFDDVYQLGIKAACTEAGAYCERLDEQVFDEGMLDQIYIQIAKADMIVADMSNQNANVFYEVGYAHALDKRVILITNSASDIPFDLKHRFHIVYEKSIATLKTKLRDRIAWYVANPGPRMVDLCDHLHFHFEGKSLVEATITNSKTNVNNRYGWRLEIAIHNPSDCKIGAITCTPTLIFPGGLLGESGEGIYSASAPIVPLPDGKSAIQNTEPIKIQPGGWINVIFEVVPWSCSENMFDVSYDLVLRMLTDGPPKDIPFKMVLCR